MAPPPESLNEDVDARGRFIDINFEDIEDDIEGLLGGLGLDADVSFEFGGKFGSIFILCYVFFTFKNLYILCKCLFRRAWFKR